MKNLLLSLAGIPLISLLLPGQEVHSWTGALVASGCQTGSTAAAMPGATVKPPREQNSTYEQAQNQAGSQRTSSSSKDSEQMARTTDRGTPVDPTTAADGKDTRDKATGVQAFNKLDASCRIGEHTSAFALLLEDGKLVRFDEAANSKIAQQLHSQPDRLQHKTKTFRVKVKGELQNGTISVDSIEI
ncbi:MAG: hypothetical protein ACR2NN_01300 [Bryobacteraceae bacterium]